MIRTEFLRLCMAPFAAVLAARSIRDTSPAVEQGTQLAVPEARDVPVLETGVVSRLMLYDESGTCLAETTVTSQAITAGATVTIPAWDAMYI